MDTPAAQGSSLATPSRMSEPVPSMDEPPKPSSHRTVYLIAGVVGLVVIGVIAVVGWILFQRSGSQSGPPLEQPQVPVEISTPRSTTAPTAQVIPLSVTSPKENDIIASASATVRGTTIPEATVAVVTDEDEVITESDTQGNFVAPLKLISGINTIIVTVFGDDGQENSITFDIVYDAQ